jgi:hypothetical protein
MGNDMTHDQGPYLGSRIEPITRRSFVKAGAALGASLALPGLSSAQVVAEIHDLRGSVKVNGQPVTRKTVIRPGDHVVTGSDGYVVFTIGGDAFMLRSRSELKIQPREDAPALAGFLNLVSGALGAAFKRGGGKRTVQVGTVTAGIRGTGVYMETRGDGTYFCTCWGTVELQSNDDATDREIVESKNHTPRFIGNKLTGRSRFKPALFETHNDQEMDILEKCVGRRSPILFPEWLNK